MNKPPKNATRGRTPFKLKADKETYKVDEIAKNEKSESWKNYTLRSTTKGNLNEDIF